MMNHLLQPQSKTLPSLGLLAFRVAMGSAFILHGFGKIQHPMSWMGPAPVPGGLQAMAAFSEFGGGIALALGLLTPLASLLLLGTMIGALSLVHLPAGDPFVSQHGEHSYELAALYLAGAVMFLLNGPGKFSLDYLLLTFWKPAAQQASHLNLKA